MAGGESKTFPSVPDRRPQGRLDRLRQEQAEKARIREAFGRNPSGLETLRFNNPRLDKVFTTLGADPLFIGNQTRVIDGRLTPVPVRRRAEGGLVAPMPRPRPEMPMAPMPRPRPEGLAATPEGEESFSFGFHSQLLSKKLLPSIQLNEMDYITRNISSPNTEKLRTLHEGDKVQDFTAEQLLVISRKDKISEMINKISSLDLEFSLFMSEHQNEIIDLLRKMEKAGESSFETRALEPKILGVTSHLIKRYPNTKAMKAMTVKPSAIEGPKQILDALQSPQLGDAVSVGINNIGNSLKIPEPVILSAIEEYEKNRPPNKEPKTMARAAAWLYIYTKNANFKINKTQIYNIPGVSRSAFNKALKSYEEFFRNIKVTLKESDVEEK